MSKFVKQLFSHQVVSDSFATPWTVAHQSPLSMGFLREEYWSGLPFPSPEDLPDRRIKPMSPALQADSLPLSPKGSPGYDLDNKSWLFKHLVRALPVVCSLHRVQ